MPITEQVLLEDHDLLSQTILHGWQAIRFGLVVFSMSLSGLVCGLGGVPSLKFLAESPLKDHFISVLIYGGAVFGLAGLALVIYGFTGLRRDQKVKEGKRKLPTHPWLWDYSWKPKGMSDHRGVIVLVHFVVLAAIVTLSIPFNLMAFSSQMSSLFWLILVVGLDVSLFIKIGWTFLKALRDYYIFGNSYLICNSFPFFLGNVASLTLKKIPSNLAEVQLVLRCIEEAYRTQETSQDSIIAPKCYQVYEDSKTLSKENIQDTGDLHMSWNLPNNEALTSTPSGRPARFWELEVSSISSGLEYKSCFLLPIYAQNPT